jgi:uncharacterized protein (DUF2164 family)
MKKLELDPDVKKQAILEIKQYFLQERDEEIGDLASDLLLTFFAEKIGLYFYNQAISDAYTFMNAKTEDLFALEQPVPRRKAKVYGKQEESSEQ